MADTIAAFAPGRVNLIGEHTDYNEGLALPFAITEGVTVRATARSEPIVSAAALDLDEEDRFALGEPSRSDGWRAFVRGAVAELRDAGVPLGGTTLEISGDIQRGSGLSSSAALEVALCLALVALNEARPLDRVALAQLCSRVENEWVGAQTGLLDQLASLFGEREHAVRIDFRSLQITSTVLELGECRLVALDSGERHSHAGSGYNQRRAECAKACEELKLASLRDATLPMAERLPPPLAGRLRHVVSENERVDEMVDALWHKDLNRVGDLLNASHASLRDDYEVSTSAVEETVARLRRAGALGARIVGGGFGGHVLGLLPPDARTPEGAVEVRAGPGARVLDADEERR